MKWHNGGSLTLLASALLWTSCWVLASLVVSGLPRVLQTLLNLDASCSFCCYMLVQWLYPGLWPAQFETLVSDCQPVISTWMYFSKLSSEYPIELSFPHSIVCAVKLWWCSSLMSVIRVEVILGIPPSQPTHPADHWLLQITQTFSAFLSVSCALCCRQCGQLLGPLGQCLPVVFLLLPHHPHLEARGPLNVHRWTSEACGFFGIKY